MSSKLTAQAPYHRFDVKRNWRALAIKLSKIENLSGALLLRKETLRETIQCLLENHRAFGKDYDGHLVYVYLLDIVEDITSSNFLPYKLWSDVSALHYSSQNA